MDYPGRLIAGFISLILLLLFPLQYIAQSNNEDIDALVSNKTKALTDTIRKKGYIDLRMYEEYLGFLNKTGELYDFEIEDINPVVGDELAEDISSDLPLYAETGRGMHVKAANTLLLHTNNKGQVNGMIITGISYGHVHTSDCYAGAEEEPELESLIFDLDSIPAKSLSSISISPSSQIVELLSEPDFRVTAYYSDGSSAEINPDLYQLTNYDPTKTGSQTVAVSYTEEGITKTAYATVFVNGLTGISVAPTELTVERYTAADSFSLTVTASYLYGSNKTYDSGYKIYGYNPSLLGKQDVIVAFTDKGITKTAELIINVAALKRLCSRCYNIYELNTDDSDPGCPFCKGFVTGIEVSPEYVEVTLGDELPVTVEAIYRDGSRAVVNGWTSNYEPDKSGIQSAVIEYGGYAKLITVNVREKELTCPECGTIYPQSAGECPICAERIIAISVEPGFVTVHQYENIEIAVTAYYADGSSRPVDDWSIDCTTSRPGSYRATVSYKNLFTIIELKVIAVTDEQCSICGYIYDQLENPYGCPICFETLTGIEAYLLSGGSRVAFGSIPDIALVLIFRDGHRELKAEGYIMEGYDPFKEGMQTVTVSYEGFETTLTLELVNSLSSVTCPEGHLYYPDEDGTDPGCPYCRLGVSNGTVRYYNIRYTSEILDELYEKGIYHFKKGNYITIRLIKRDKSLLYRLQKMFFKTAMLGRIKRFVFGGEIL